jgi:NTE family protein
MEGIFGDLSASDRSVVLEHVNRRSLKRGEVLVRAGDPSDSVFLVESGRFSVLVGTHPEPVAEVGVGEPIGEIGFFTKVPRTATVVAARDSEVVQLDRAAFNTVVAKYPRIYEAILMSLAGRLAETTARVPVFSNITIPRTIAIVTGGRGGLDPAFLERLQSVFERRGRTLFVGEGDVAKRFPGVAFDHPTVSRWLNAVENEYALVVYIADDTASEWSRKAIRQADQVIIAVSGAAVNGLNPAEAFAFGTHPQTHRRLVIVHENRMPSATATADWLKERPVFMHHHMALEDDVDFASLHRFVSGRAIGFVAGGGGAFGSAHIGIYKAFSERGVTFDIFGGTSVGAAMMAGFAALRDADSMNEVTEDVFVRSRGLDRKTVPRYSMIDHVVFDVGLQRVCRGVNIEDAWRPFFAMATDLSANAPYIFRTGPVWRAVRASGSVPGMLPPMFMPDGRMLVDGSFVDNLPLTPMRGLKTGPNLIVHFGLPTFEAFKVDYASIPGRWPLVRRLIFARHKLPDAPGPVNVLRRCLFANQRFDLHSLEKHDLMMAPPPFPGSSFLDFDRHAEVSEAAYHWAMERIDALVAEGDPAITAILKSSE